MFHRCSCLVLAVVCATPSVAAPCIDDPDGGTFECTAPTPSAETMSMGECYAPWFYRDAVFGACGWGSVSSLGDAISKANCADVAFGGPGGVSGSWAGVGDTWNTYWCGNQSVGMQNGILTYTFAALKKDSTDGYLRPTLVSRWRTLECPAGYSRGSRPNGDIVCMRPVSDSCPAVGDPIAVSSSSNSYVEEDYAGAELVFSRTYNSDGIFRPLWAPEPVVKPFGANWTHSYESRVFPAPANLPAMAIALRADGSIHHFDAMGREMTNKSAPMVIERVAAPSVIAWRLRPSGSDVEEYDASGSLLRITSGGRVVRLSYSDAATPTTIAPYPGLLTQVTDTQGRSLRFFHDVQGHLSKMVDPDGREHLYAFNGPSIPRTDPTRNVTSVTRPDGARRTYVYDEVAYTSGAPRNGALTGILDAVGGRFQTFRYRANGDAAGTTFAGGADQYQVTTTPAGTAVTNPLGHVSTYEFQSAAGVRKNVAEIRPCVGAGCTGQSRRQLTYDTAGDVASITDFDGARTLYQHDPIRHLEIQRTEAAGSPVQRTISTQWHPTLDLPVKLAEPLRITTLAYNGDGVICGRGPDGMTLIPGLLCSRTIQPTSDANGGAGFAAIAAGTPRVWTYTYDANGRRLSEDGPRTDVSDVTTYTYDAQGNLASVSNALGQVSRLTSYTAAGRLQSSSDPNGLVTVFGYDAMDRVIRTDVGGEVTTFGYDTNGELARLTRPNGATESYTRDDAHRVIAKTDALGNQLRFALDAMGNRTQEQVFDSKGALLHVRAASFDPLSRRSADVGAHGQTFSYAYGLNDEVFRTTDPLGRTTQRSYDQLKRLTRVSFPMGSTVQLTYDALSNVTAVVDPRGIQTSFVYDGLGNRVSSFSRDEGVRIFTYDEAGNLKSKVDAKGLLTRYEHDALNRLTAIHYADGTQETRTYDQGPFGIGHLTQMTDATGTTSYAYDLHGRLIRETAARATSVASVSLTTRYAYDARGRVATMTYPSGRTVTYAYDAEGRMTKIDGTRSGVTRTLVQAVTRRPFGEVEAFTSSTGSRMERTFDLDGRITGFTVAGTRWGISYDVASRITALSAPGVSRTFAYDDLDRLVQVSGGVNESFVYDLNGNRTSLATGPRTESLTYSANSNHLTRRDTANFVWDANGNLVSDGMRQFTYDQRGRLVEMKVEQATARYFINGQGRRVAKEVQP